MFFGSDYFVGYGRWLLFLGMFSTGSLQAQNTFPLRAMAANITSSNHQSYEAEGIRIFQGLKPDVVAIQEFKYNSSSASNDLRLLVDRAFGTNFSFYCEPSGNIPNGIVSRWPIVAGGSWDDPLVSDRGFAWAHIQLPGSNDLYVVSVHLYGTGSPVDRGIEANIVKDHIQTNIPPGSWVIVGGDFNAGNRGEACVSNFKTILSDSPIPTDHTSGGDPTTNEPRSEQYDYLMPSFSLTNRQVSVVIGPQTFTKGLVFDSSVYSSNYTLAAVAPVQAGDSHVFGMQHMAVVKDFVIPTNSTPEPPFITAQPQGQTNIAGANATFTVLATGTAPLNYQWRLGDTNIAGTTASSYTRTNIQTDDIGDYQVVITNAYGSVTSAIAKLGVTLGQPGVLTTLTGWDVNGLTGYGPSPLPPWTNASNVTVAGLTRGSGVTTINTAVANTWGGNGFDAASAAAAAAAGDYVTFVITPNSGYRVSFDAISRFDYRRSGSGPANGVLQYQVDTGTFVDITALAFPSTSGAQLSPIDLSGLVALQNVPAGTAITFRIVNYGGGSGANWYIYDFAGNSAPDLAVRGTVTPVNATNPAAIPPTLSMPTNVANQVIFMLTGSTGTNYVIQATTNLNEGNWVSVRTNAAPFTFTESNANVIAQRFYRGLVAP